MVVIAFLVYHFAKGSSNNAAGSSTPSAGASTAAGGATSGYVFTQATAVGKYPLNKTATKEYTPVAENQAAPVAADSNAAELALPGKESALNLIVATWAGAPNVPLGWRYAMYRLNWN